MVVRILNAVEESRPPKVVIGMVRESCDGAPGKRIARGVHDKNRGCRPGSCLKGLADLVGKRCLASVIFLVDLDHRYV
jgi:hypothetical protein